MYRSAPVDDRIRAAHAARGERDRLRAISTALAADVREAEQQVDRLALALADEERDVGRYERGVWAFLYDIFADREARLTKEQREAAAARARHDEAVTSRDRLRERAAEVATRLAALAGVDAELTAARAAKYDAVIGTDTPIARELEQLVTASAGVDAELQAISEALVAGDAARGSLDRLAAVLASARGWGTADILTDSFLISWAKRNKLDEARGLAGAAQAALTVFQRELADVGIGLDAELASLANHHRFLDTWFDNIFSDLSVQSRIGDAQATTQRALASVGERLAVLRARHGSLVARAQHLAQTRDRLIDPPADGQGD